MIVVVKVVMAEKKQLSDEDMARVNEYLSTSIHRVKRKPYRFFVLLAVCWAVVAALGGFAYWFAKLMGFV